jgi:alkylhydroperoxidase family enzyme
MKLTREPSAITAEDAERLRAQGLSDAGIHDAIQVVSFFNYINRVAEAVGIDDEPDWKGRGTS